MTKEKISQIRNASFEAMMVAQELMERVDSSYWKNFAEILYDANGGTFHLLCDKNVVELLTRDCLDSIHVENDKLREENKKLRDDLASAKAEFENYKSWERDYANGQVQGMW